jgi:preprotein translocase subunit SecG
MNKNKKEKIKRWVTIAVILFMVLILVLAYMPGLFMN